MDTNTQKLEESERIAIGLYQEKIAYWQNLLTQFISSALEHRGLEPKDCVIDARTGLITIKKAEKEEST